jgi:hypothetical protein
MATTITNQSQDALEVTYKQVTALRGTPIVASSCVAQLKEKFPILEERFEGDWPARAMVQGFLKNTSAKSSTSKSK